MNRIKMAAAACVVAVLSVAAGYFSAPEDFDIPIRLSDGEIMTQPCYVTVDGQSIALVESEETAEKVMEQVKDEYKNEKTVEVRIQEETSVEKMELENGDNRPDILTEDQAAQQMFESDAVTVESKDLIIEGVTEEYETITNETEDMDIGESRIVQQGRNGFVLRTKEIVRENGEVTEEKVIGQRILAETMPEIILKGTAGLADPLDQMRLTSGFGYRWGRQHAGIDLGMPAGSPVYAAKGGTVICSGYYAGFGNLIRIKHDNGMETYYAHCSKLIAEEGQYVESGEVIAEVGSTGNSTGPHLHFEVRINGEPQNPMDWLESEK